MIRVKVREFVRSLFPGRFRILAWVLLIAAAATIPAQSSKVTWRAALVPPDVRAGETAQIQVTATMLKDWHIYAFKQEGGPVSTTVVAEPGDEFEVLAESIEPPPQRKFDEGFQQEIGFHEGEATFAIPIRIKDGASGSFAIKVKARSQACNANTCDQPTTHPLELSVNILPGETRPERNKPNLDVPAQPAGWVSPPPSSGGPPKTKQTEAGDQKPDDAFSNELGTARAAGLGSYLWLSFLFGLLALLTPCVFPMIPVTVSYFSKRTEEDPKSNYAGALAYCLGIIGTFTALGLAVTLIFGATGIQRLATNPVINLGLAILFIVLAANLFGVFEIGMPSWLVNKAGTRSRKGGLLGPVLMGLTFTLTSFTCTVPFVGTLLVGAAQGDVFYPALGMLAFSTAFSIPFFLLALFPHFLNKMPRAGSWMASVKVFMGFLELAAAVKFLSNADLVWQLGWITRSVFLALWAGISAVASLYLLGWVMLPHESPPKVGIPRRLLGIAMAAACVWSLAGLQGRSLGELSAFMPPDPYPGTKGVTADGIKWIHDYDQALAQAKSTGKPMFVNFTGVTCTNCRWMEANMFTRAAVAGGINNYIPVELYTDRETPEDMKNRDLEQKLTGVITLPVYVLVSPDGKPLKVFQGSTRDEQAFVAFLEADTKVAAN